MTTQSRQWQKAHLAARSTCGIALLQQQRLLQLLILRQTRGPRGGGHGGSGGGALGTTVLAAAGSASSGLGAGRLRHRLLLRLLKGEGMLFQGSSTLRNKTAWRGLQCRADSHHVSS